MPTGARSEAVADSLSWLGDESMTKIHIAALAPGFEAVAEEFERNFSSREEIGASFAAMREGKYVVDLWGGLADQMDGSEWSRNTLQTIFSGTKGLVAISLLLLIDRGELSLDRPVATYWPEFAAADKESVTVRDVVTHRARIPAIQRPVSIPDLLDARKIADLLAAQPAFADPRAPMAYHPLTFGWLCGELIRRVDGRRPGRFFAEEIAGPLGLDIYIGVPEDEESRVSRLALASTWGQSGPFSTSPRDHDELMRLVWTNPVVWTRDSFPWNSSEFRRAELPAVNGVGTARALAGLYGSLDRILSADALKLAEAELERRRDPLEDEAQAFSVGFQLQTELSPFGPAKVAFGHSGAGGSVHGRWPEHDVGFSYAMNLLRDDQPAGDSRAAALLTALYDCL